MGVPQAEELGAAQPEVSVKKLGVEWVGLSVERVQAVREVLVLARWGQLVLVERE